MYLFPLNEAYISSLQLLDLSFPREVKSTDRAHPPLMPCIIARIFKRLWSPGIDSKEWIPPAYVARRAGTITLFLLGA
jgi:hypothetical protein